MWLISWQPFCTWIVDETIKHYEDPCIVTQIYTKQQTQALRQMHHPGSQGVWQIKKIINMGLTQKLCYKKVCMSWFQHFLPMTMSFFRHVCEMAWPFFSWNRPHVLCHNVLKWAKVSCDCVAVFGNDMCCCCHFYRSLCHFLDMFVKWLGRFSHEIGHMYYATTCWSGQKCLAIAWLFLETEMCFTWPFFTYTCIVLDMWWTFFRVNLAIMKGIIAWHSISMLRSTQPPAIRLN